MASQKVIAIDGPAGAGKSTVAKKLATILDFAYLDTGAMYRALTLKSIRHAINLENEDLVVALANKTCIDIQNNQDGGIKVLLDGEDVSKEIRTLEVTNNTFYIARAPRIRSIMVQWQRQLGQGKSVVAEGRDIGTVVFPEATYKFYLDANLEERAARRIKELKAAGKKVDEKQLLNEVNARDQKDLTRSTGPLKKADDAIIIDSTHLTIDGVVEKIRQHIKVINQS